MPPQKELKPPPEMVEAMQNSDDMTAPAEFAVGAEFGSDVPRTVRNRLVHEEPQKLSHDDEEEGGEGKERMTKRELKIKMMQFEKERHNRYDRNHPGGGRAGQGDAGTTHSQMATRGEGGGRMRYGHD
ncbi:hypothetical protein HYH02_007198 [Chlamydomonas schloesseri]|uniref:Uncharacterized protein n=1 Tax=Chlamydomonas schloesseri TaxID=2026947 RepID=A0A835WI37_9CHLO|nr:hypothetical protein HYH02_007198 [Chlamydomonas schloesseri]|eukprot:KAG2447738.1 hypothetical protein HYH02_007198 [Chlamydomonas schloesseri]